MAAVKCGRCKQPRMDLNCRVTVQQLKAAATVDGHGEINRSLDANWETYATRWSAFKSRGGSERFASDMIQAGQTHRVYLRYDSVAAAITTEMRATYDSRTFGILAVVDVDEQHQWIQLDVAEDK